MNRALRLPLFAIAIGSFATASYSQTTTSLCDSSQSSGKLSKFFLTNAVCEAVSPETKAARMKERDRLKNELPDCFRAFESSAERMQFLAQVTAETAANPPKAAKENCQTIFGEGR